MITNDYDLWIEYATLPTQEFVDNINSDSRLGKSIARCRIDGHLLYSNFSLDTVELAVNTASRILVASNLN